MTSHAASYHGYRFPPEIISHAVWLYHRFCLSFRDTEGLLAQRGITVSYEGIRQWCQRLVLRTLGFCGAGKDAWATRGTWTNCS
jgi:putative transposase